MKFIKIPYDSLHAGTIYTHDIFLFDKNSENRVVAFYANEPIDDERLSEVGAMSQQGGILQIIYDDMDDFCQISSLPAYELTKLNYLFFKMVDLEEKRKVQYFSDCQRPFIPRLFFEGLGNMKELRKMVKSHILMFPLTISDEVSLTTQIIDIVFTRDGENIQEVCLCFALAKLHKIDDPQILSSIILASLFKDLGLTQISRDEILNFDHHSDFYYKHPMLTLYVLSKSNFSFSNLTKRIILEHHELADGTGYPRGKKEGYTHFLAHLVRVSHEIVNLVHGKYNKDYSWNEAFEIISKQKDIPGLEHKFPYSIIGLVKMLQI